MKQFTFLTISTIFSLFLISKEVFACSCLPSTVEEAYKDSPIIFLGEVADSKLIVASAPLDEKESIYWEEVEVYFKVDKVYKGIGQVADLSLRTADNSAACGYNFTIGEKYLVYAYVSEGQVSTGLCTRTAPIFSKEALSDIRWMENLK